MRRWIAAVLLFVLLPWQAVGLAATAMADDGHDALHAIAHWAGQAHHHDGHDGGFHLDDSEESVQHAVHSDVQLNAVAVLPLAVKWTAWVESAAAPDHVQPGGHPCPFLEGPRRPPRSDC